MIYEDNEEKAEAGKETSPTNDKNDQKKEDTGTSSFDEKSSSSNNRKSKTKKKRHYQQLQQQQFQLQSDDHLIHDIIEEILKLENLTNLLNKNQHDELKNLIKSEMKLFHNLKKLEMNFVTLLVGPILHPSPNSSMSLEEEDQRFENLMQKLRKNLEVLKKIEPTGETKPTGDIYNDDEYLQSLRKSLDRHNSMQLLLHMQNPNLQQQKPSVLSSNFLSDDQLDGELESSSPPPPAPNGDVYYPADDVTLEQEWNPFHVDIMMMKEQRAASLSPYRAVQPHVSPKNTKSDSGLSSMSGFSSFEKSPNSPSYSLPYDRVRYVSSYQQMKATEVQQPPEGVYGEENLNYIRELSQNAPICSIYENKSIFDQVANIKPPSAWEMYMKNQQDRLQQAQEETTNLKAYPDLIANQEQQLEALIEQRKRLDAQKQQLKQEQQQLQQQMAQKPKKRQQLVYYPSQQSITDYNSSMNLEYQREYPSHQNLQHDEFMQHAHAQQQVHLQRQQRLEEQPAVVPKKPSSKHQYLNKKIEKVQHWLPEIKSIKKMSKKHRSHSLPAVESDEDYRMNIKKQNAPPNTQGNKKGDIYVMKNYMKGKKKEIVRTMSSMMHKAQKSVRRHSFSHHHLSDEEGAQGSSPKRAARSMSSGPSSRYSDTEASDISSIFSDSDDRPPPPVFATVGDSKSKHSDAGDSDDKQNFNLNFTSTSMEFAASRKVGMLRKKSTNADDMSDVSPVEGGDVVFEKSKKSEKHLIRQNHSIFVDSMEGEEEVRKPVPTPRGQHQESHEVVFEQMKSPQGSSGSHKSSPSPGSGNSGQFMKVSPQSQVMFTQVQTNTTQKSSFEKMTSQGQLKVDQISPQGQNGQIKPIPSPRFEHSRSNSMKNSLEVPGGGEEDSRSQNSFRTSISSRRQSTEDSIDTDDEYFYYEMRNLEELERNSHMESLLQDNKEQILNNITSLDTNLIEPDEDVKKNMSFVLHELKAKVKLREPISDQQDLLNNNKKKDIYDKFGIATNINDMPWNRDSDEDYNDDGGYMDQLNQFETEIRDASYGKVKKKRKKREKYEKSSSSSADEDDKHLTVEKFERPHSQSSGVTSGPDSPIASDDELQAENYEQFKERQKNERLLEHSQQLEHTTDDRGASENKIPPGSAAAEAELGGEESNDKVAPLKKKLMQLSSTISTDSTTQDSGISDTSGGAVGAMSGMGSKWKLLKTLKERKEMNNQVKIKEEEEGVKETVKVREGMSF